MVACTHIPMSTEQCTTSIDQNTTRKQFNICHLLKCSLNRAKPQKSHTIQSQNFGQRFYSLQFRFSKLKLAYLYAESIVHFCLALVRGRISIIAHWKNNNCARFIEIVECTELIPFFRRLCHITFDVNSSFLFLPNLFVGTKINPYMGKNDYISKICWQTINVEVFAYLYWPNKKK